MAKEKEAKRMEREVIKTAIVAEKKDKGGQKSKWQLKERSKNP